MSINPPGKILFGKHSIELPPAPTPPLPQTALDERTGRRRRQGRLPLLGLGLLGLLLVALLACQPWTPPAPAPTFTIAWTPTFTSTPTLTLTLTPTLTPTITLSPTPAATLNGLQVLTVTPITGAEPPPCTAVGQKWVSPLDGMVLVCVPAGEFLMGAGDSDKQAEKDERPQHKVNLNAFWVDQTEVTNGMYQKCVQAGKCSAPSRTSSYTRNPYYGAGQYTNFPVIYVSWEGARAYCAWAGRRLPSEAEWEKAARGADGRIYPWGNQPIAGNLVNFADKNTSFDWSDKSIDDGFGDTSPAGNYPLGASPYGALDMAGNVWEWVADWYGETYFQNSPLSNPPGPASGQSRVMRGGSWINVSWNLRVSFRDGALPGDRYNSCGFRCSR